MVATLDTILVEHLEEAFNLILDPVSGQGTSTDLGWYLRRVPWYYYKPMLKCHVPWQGRYWKEDQLTAGFGFWWMTSVLVPVRRNVEGSGAQTIKDGNHGQSWKGGQMRAIRHYVLL